MRTMATNTAPGHASEFFYIFTQNKYSKVGVGFAELIFMDPSKKAGHLSKLYVSRVYRKIKKSEKIYAKLVGMLFQTFKLEKISITILFGNETQSEDLKNLGFKLDKQFVRDGIRMRKLSVRHQDFYGFNPDPNSGGLVVQKRSENP